MVLYRLVFVLWLRKERNVKRIDGIIKEYHKDDDIWLMGL